eukprot:jgi/Botrbrau1/4861/Bobra.0032s0019.2
MYTGGPVWSVDWGPRFTPSQGCAGFHLLAVAAHPRARTENNLGECVSGPALLQVWGVPDLKVAPRPSPTQSARNAANDSPASDPLPVPDGALPRQLLGICHEGGLTWDCKWQYSCDRTAVQPAPVEAGTLALALGSGSVVLLEVPLEDLREAARGTDPHFIDVQPFAALRVPDSPAGCLEWLPSKPYDRLLVGCWDGSVLVTKVTGSPGTPGRQLSLLSQVVGSGGLPIRAVAWAPPEICEASSDAGHCHMFACCGHDCNVRIWDTRDPVTPHTQLPFTTVWAFSLAWIGVGLVGGLDQGIVAMVPLKADKALGVSAMQGLTHDPVWCVHACPGTNIVAAASSTGELACFPVSDKPKTRYRTPHAPLAAVASTPEGVCLLGQEAADHCSTMYRGSGRDAARLPTARLVGLEDAHAPLYCTRWGPRVGPNTILLAHGGAAGVVRCQAVVLPSRSRQMDESGSE